ncbi:hypothetical protein GWI33_001231 [Rhynchophorus ferrugineus]|uniref:Uncharacterized protein n=1 Tax=Rhynchophorus ferrugineus TaxID=354439 RepID=A0A834MGZ8_RHYFE|nr:hypothetical protein GWI33_001231 [Rhynchophorus ferrugineus]
MEEANNSNEKVTEVHVETKVSKKTIVKKYKKSKTLKRRNRRKRSKKSYIKSLKRRRYHRSTEELWKGIEDISVTDMDVMPLNELDRLPEEISEWEKQEQIAYWKSRAISLEMENKMLHQHLRNVYAQQVEYYQNSSLEYTEQENNNKDTDTHDKNNSKSHTQRLKNKGKPDEITKTEKVLPKEPKGKNRLNEMKGIYGDMAPKIMGMETAIDLNFERLKEEGTYINWPNIPIKL